MSWLMTYLTVALIVAAAAFVGAQLVIDQRIPAPERPGVVALVTGAVWPVLIAGGLQLAALMVFRRWLTGSGRTAVRERPASLASGYAER